MNYKIIIWYFNHIVVNYNIVTHIKNTLGFAVNNYLSRTENHKICSAYVNKLNYFNRYNLITIKYKNIFFIFKVKMFV